MYQRTSTVSEAIRNISSVRPLASLDLALVGNCAVSALIDPLARVVWCCMPRFDSPPVFHALLDSAQGLPEHGCMAVQLENCSRSSQAYVPGTAVLRTSLFNDAGDGIEITDFAPRFQHHDRMFRPAQLVRRIRPLSGRPRVRITVRPCGDWGASAPEPTRGSHHLRYPLPATTLRLTTNAPPTYLAEGTLFSLQAPVSLLLGPDETLADGVEDTARLFEEQTLLHWRQWTRRLALPLEWQDAVIRAAITLKLCQYEETGAIVAAMTTSIPEAADSGRTWDYRYCWLRDAFFVVRALNTLAEMGTLEGYLRWLQDVVRNADGGHVQPLYGLGLEQQLPEWTVSHLAGYRGMGPVRCGNQAFEHHQHDVYGNIVLGAAQAFHDHRLFQRAGLADFQALERVGEQAWRLHDQPDAGIWELRTRASVHTSSALMCWAACDRLAKIARALGLGARAKVWTRRASAIRRTILRRAWSPRRQSFTESFDGETLDASLLLMGEVGFLPGEDPRFRATVLAMERSLCDGPHVRRYEQADDFGTPQVAFSACSLWRIDALARIGERERARADFETLLACRNPAGLLSEDIDPRDGSLWGNFPQTYSMVGIIHCAVRLSEPWDTRV
jgi:GH15 family glucan-1,4-alpha-glucosidase